MLVTIFASLALVVLLIVAGRSWAADVPGPTTGAPAAPAEVPTPAPLTQEQLASRLAALVKTPAPQELKMGAMCYKMVSPPDQADHVCPRCSGRSVYVRPVLPPGGADKAYAEAARRFTTIQSDIPSCRSLIAALSPIQATLDESEFCATCTPTIASPELVLVIRPSQAGAPRRFRGITPHDLQVLKAFLSGQDRYEWGQGREYPLANQLPRIALILGLDTP